MKTLSTAMEVWGGKAHVFPVILVAKGVGPQQLTHNEPNVHLASVCLFANRVLAHRRER